MDSGNSGSLQSSSGGDEEYDSRAADSISAFMNTHQKPHGGPISNSPPPLFDPLSSYLQLNQNPNSHFLNPNMAWPRPTLRSDPNNSYRDIMNNPMLSTSPSFMASFQPPPAAVGADSSNTGVPPPPPQSQNQTAARNPKKRSRASRRAPTTVLTTDTTNFRAMVQEFTGIPAPPFNSSSFPRSRLDLFGTRSTSLDAPPYLRRPFAQKVQSPPPFLSSSASPLLNSTTLDAIATTNNAMTSVSSNSTPTPSINYQLPITQSSNLFNPLLNSLLQTNPKFPFSNSPPHFMGSKLQNSSFGNIPQNEFGVGGGGGHGNHISATLSPLPNLISSDQVAAQNERNEQGDDNNNNAANWRNNGISPDDGGDDHHQARMRSVNGGGGDYIPRSGKMNDYLASTSENNVASRGEGMVESWICSSE